MFSYLSPEQRVPSDHPLRAIRLLTDTILTQLSQGSHACMPNSDAGRFRRRNCCGPCCYRCCTRWRSERMLMEQLEYNMLFRWFV